MDKHKTYGMSMFEPSCNAKIGVSIKAARLNAKYTQTALAEKISTSHAAISFWENGVNIPNVLDCWKIADVLEISIDELIGRS